MSVTKFEDLQIWQLAREFARLIFEVTKNPLFVKNFHITDQILRSSGSVMDNIAEGFCRGGNKEFINYLSIAKASCGETKSQLYRAFDYGYINETTLVDLTGKAGELSAKIQSLMNHLKKSGYKGHKFK